MSTHGEALPGDKFLEIASGSDRRVLDALFRHAREGVTIQGPDGLVYANDRAAQLVGLETGRQMLDTPVQELLSRFEMVDEKGEPFSFERLPGRLVLAGESPDEITIGYRVTSSRQVKWSRVAASPIKSDTGQVVWALNFFLDVTDEVALRVRERIVTSVTEALSGSLQVTPNLMALTDIIVPEIASWCSFHILDDYDDLVPSAIAFPKTSDAEALVALVEPGPISRDSDRMEARVIASAKREFIPELTEETLQAVEQERGAEFAELLRRLDLGSILCVPLGVEGSLMGTMTMARSRAEGRFERADLALIDEIALRAGVALTNARAFEREHQTAEALRSGLRPRSLPMIEGLEVATRYLPVARQGHLGGDFYDLIPLGTDRAIALLGDIEGKGVEAAAAVGLVRQTLRTTISLDPSPLVVFKQLNDAVNTQHSHSRMCTLAYVSLTREGDGFSGTLALAGHPPPLVLRKDGSIDLLGEVAPPAGLFDDLAPIPRDFELLPGDLIVLYTDGLAGPGLTAPETVERLIQQVETTEPELALTRILELFSQEVPVPRDDIAILAIRVVG